MQIDQSVYDKKASFIKNVIWSTEYHFSLQLIFFLVLSCSLFSNDISWIHFHEH